MFLVVPLFSKRNKKSKRIENNPELLKQLEELKSEYESNKLDIENVYKRKKYKLKEKKKKDIQVLKKEFNRKKKELRKNINNEG